MSNTNITDDIETYRRKLSYIPESPVIYDELTLQEHIEMTAMVITFCFIPFEKWLGKTFNSSCNLNIFNNGSALFMAYGLSQEEAMKRAEPLLKIFRLQDELKVFPSHFS
jgi:ABC-2 type transport system ATP-binding protein